MPAPDPADPDLARFAADRDGLKRDLADRLRAAGEKPTPKLVERELARIERGRAALDAIEAIEAAGGARALAPGRTSPTATRSQRRSNAALAASGRIDVLVHAGGLEISHFLPDKPQQEFDLVFDVKADGWHHILDALGDARPRAAVVFSSIAGRFGNAGQTDYAAANDLLCKAISQLRAEGVHGIAIDWTAWAQIGMASRGSIPKVMEAAGIDMLPPEHGIAVVRRELTAPGRRRGARRRRARRADRGAPPERRARRRARRPDDRPRRRHDRRRRAARAAPSSTPPSSRSCTTTASTAPPCCPA